MLGHFTPSHEIVLGHLALSQDLTLKCWDTSHCPKTTQSSVGKLRTVPRSFVLVLGHFTLSQELVLGHFVLPRPLTQVLGHLALSQDLPIKCWDTSHCPKTPHSSVGIVHTVPRTSVGTFRTVPRPPTQVLGHSALFQDCLLKCLDSSHCPKTTCSSVGTPRTVPRPLIRALG